MEEKKQKPQPASIHIGGDVGPGAAIGPGASVQADQIAGGDIIISGQPVPKTQEEFMRQLQALQTLITQAVQAGEIPAGRDADDAVGQLHQAAEMAEEEKPPKSRILRRLEDVKEILDSSAETAKAAGRVGTTLLKAVPIVKALIELAQAVF